LKVMQNGDANVTCKLGCQKNKSWAGEDWKQHKGNIRVAYHNNNND